MSVDRSQAIVREMLDARGYEVIETDNDKMIAEHDDDHIFIISVTDPKLNTNTVKDVVAILTELSNENFRLNHAIIIYNDTITSGARKIIETVETSHGMTIEYFDRANLQFNITRHYLQPKFVKCVGEEMEEVKRKWGVKLPVMLKNDPIARFYNYARGDVIRVTRSSGFVTYRIVK
jgi:DNA-directed RNA polymerase subunit H (RpoH/RPB5)